MSFQASTDLELEERIRETLKDDDASPFEKHIMQCCKAPEWELRRWLKKVLTRAGFEIFEDGYRTERCAKEKRYESVHNMVAIRGKNPSVCLVAHTDVCRDHEALTSGSRFSGWGEYHHWMQGGRQEEEIEERAPRKVEPVIKKIDHEGVIRRVIQDKDCKLQVGGDDRLGVAINTYIALNTGYDMGLYFPTDEEIGLKSASVCEMPQLKEFELLVQTDRGNHSNELVIKIGGEILCSYDHVVRLLEIAYDQGCPRAPVSGLSTDVYALKRRNMCKNAVNMTCGYFDSRGAHAGEYIEISEARDTLKFCASIIKDYYLNP